VCGLKSLEVYGSDLKNGFYRREEMRGISISKLEVKFKHLFKA
jgi:hypothetical protein